VIRLGEALEGARLLATLPRFLRRPITVDEARRTLRRRLEHRADNFLELARDAIFARPSSVYRRLLALAGCEYGDLARLVRREGVEATLATLLRHGVYLTVDEFKGRRPIVRGTSTIVARPGDMRDAAAAAHLSVDTGGSRGAATSVPIDLAFVRSRAVDSCLAFHAIGGGEWSHAVWGVPGGAMIVVMLECAAFGAGWAGGSPRSIPGTRICPPATGGARCAGAAWAHPGACPSSSTPPSPRRRRSFAGSTRRDRRAERRTSTRTRAPRFGSARPLRPRG
jgi:hypothetical protein